MKTYFVLFTLYGRVESRCILSFEAVGELSSDDLRGLLSMVYSQRLAGDIVDASEVAGRGFANLAKNGFEKIIALAEGNNTGGKFDTTWAIEVVD